MKIKQAMKRAWSKKSAPIVPQKFTAEVQLGGAKAMALQELANRHEIEGYKVTREFFNRDVFKEPVQFIRINIENMQDETGYFYYRKGPFLINKIPYMRWSQAWAFHALTSFAMET